MQSGFCKQCEAGKVSDLDTRFHGYCATCWQASDGPLRTTLAETASVIDLVSGDEPRELFEAHLDWVSDGEAEAGGAEVRATARFEVLASHFDEHLGEPNESVEDSLVEQLDGLLPIELDVVNLVAWPLARGCHLALIQIEQNGNFDTFFARLDVAP